MYLRQRKRLLSNRFPKRCQRRWLIQRVFRSGSLTVPHPPKQRVEYMLVQRVRRQHGT